MPGSTMEALRLQLETLNLEKQKLEVENAKLRSHLSSDKEELQKENAELKQEIMETKRLYDDLLHSRSTGDNSELNELETRLRDEVEAKLELENAVTTLQVQLDAAHRRSCEDEDEIRRQNLLQEELKQTISELMSKNTELRSQYEHISMECELKIHRAVAKEREKWELREERFLKLQENTPTIATTTTTPPEFCLSSSKNLSDKIGRQQYSDQSLVLDEPDTDKEKLMTSITTAQLPPIPKFSGDDKDDGDVDGFSGWLEQFNMVASVCKWNEQTKLVNLIMRLKGPAYAFYRTCSPDQRSSFGQLAVELEKRFTPVRIPVVESNMFHERKQGPYESVDEYAQDLKRLFYKAYPRIQQCTREAEDMGQSVLTYQFLAGLSSDIKAKLVGTDGDFNVLLVKARFEEAKKRDFKSSLSVSTPRSSPAQVVKGASSSGQRQIFGGAAPKIGECYVCGVKGHRARECYYRGRAAPVESKWKPKVPTGNQSAPRVAAVHTEDDTDCSSRSTRVEELKRELRLAELEEVVEDIRGTLHHVTTSEDSKEKTRTLGPTLTTTVHLEGMPITALLDTGSPVSIVSLKKILMAFAHNRPQGQTKDEWEKAVKAKFSPSLITLRNYGGDELSIVGQVSVSVARSNDYNIKATLHVQSNASVDMLVGTDLLPYLGFAFVQVETHGLGRDIFVNGTQYYKVCDDTTRDDIQHIKKKEPEREIGIKSDTLTDKNPEVQVHLVTAVRVPPGHSQVIKAKVQGTWPNQVKSMFEPSMDVLEDTGIKMDPTMVVPDDCNCITLAVHNLSLSTVKVSPGQALGAICEVDEHDSSEDDGVLVHAITTLTPEAMEERIHKIWDSMPMQDSSLSPDQCKQVHTIVSRFQHLFAVHPSELGKTELVKHSIDTGDQLPIKQAARRLPFALRETVEGMVDEMLQQGVVRKSRSPWASPVVLVRKKDGSMRFCIDYRRLNAVTKKDVFPLPRIDDALDQLAGSRYFSTLDLVSGYWQVTMDGNSQEKTAFATHNGLYEFSVMPFGLCNAPATFQRLMEQVLEGLTGRCCMVYLDDVLVMGRTFEEHLQNLEKVFQRLIDAGLRLKPNKCHLIQTRVEYLGYVVSENGVEADPRKVKAILEFPIPTTLKALKSFLGLASYYRRFVPRFSEIAHPLHQLTKKDIEFNWDTDCQMAFDRLKFVLTDSTTLSYPDFSREFILETDASKAGLGAVLSQVQNELMRPIAYGSRTLQAHEQNYGITELEALAVVWAVKHFRPYIYGHCCKVITDHQALKSLLNTPQPSGKLARWGMALQDVDITIEYRPGRKNEKADALSRYPTDLTPTQSNQDPYVVIAATTTDEVLEPSLNVRQRKDPTLKPIIDYLERRILPLEEEVARTILLSEDRYTLVDDVLFRIEADKTLRIIPPTPDRKNIWMQLHSGCYGGHLRCAKTHGQLSKHYWWSGMRSDIIDWCRECRVCASRDIGRKLKVPLTPIPVGGPFDRIGVDVIKFPKSSRGHQYAVVFVDYLTKWPEVFPVKNQLAPTIAKLLVENIICRHGVPTELLSDRGANFLSNLMYEVYSLMGIRKVNTTAYHPQTDGLVERFNRTLTEMLAKTVSNNGRDWDLHLPFVLFAYRTSLQTSTGESPFYLLYGRDPQLPTDEALKVDPERDHVNTDDYKRNLTRSLAEAWELARDNIKRAQKRQKQDYDRGTRDPLISVGDRVFIYMPAAEQGPNRKFARPFCGPYRVIEKHQNTVVARPVDQPGTTPIHVSLSRVRQCPHQISDVFWPLKQKNTSIEGCDVDGPGDTSSIDENNLEDEPHQIADVCLSNREDELDVRATKDTSSVNNNSNEEDPNQISDVYHHTREDEFDAHATGDTSRARGVNRTLTTTNENDTNTTSVETEEPIARRLRKRKTPVCYIVADDKI